MKAKAADTTPEPFLLTQARRDPPQRRLEPPSLSDPKGSSIVSDGARWLASAPPDIRELVNKLQRGEIRAADLPVSDSRTAAALGILRLLRAGERQGGIRV
jgi:hypothetical protein